MAASPLTWSWLAWKLMLTAFLLKLFAIEGEPRLQESSGNSSAGLETILPSVMIAILVRNKAHVAPWFFGCLENLDYPKDRISIWIRSDHNIDNTASVLKEWHDGASELYHSVHLEIDDSSRGYADEQSATHWSDDRFSHVMELRQEALETARRKWADYIFMLDADILLENRRTLSLLMEQKKTVIAPMLNVSVESLYSNFWCGMNDEGYYLRTLEYEPIVRRLKTGCFKVPMIHSALLVNLRHKVSQNLAYYPPPLDYKGPYDDIIQFAHSAKNSNISLYILNTEYFGHILIPLEIQNNLLDESDQLLHVKLESFVMDIVLPKSPFISVDEPVPDLLGFDQVYVINLRRRPERRRKMVASLKELGVKALFVDAVDGQLLNTTYLQKRGITALPGYADPYYGRALTMGEIGCFLSHFRIWEDVVANSYERIVIFEDDVRFEPYFRQKLNRLVYEAEHIIKKWDLIYLGRKRLFREPEPDVPGTTMLILPNYSYWTLSYMLSQSGAQKLLQQQPLTKMVPVDEYLPIMFDKHPEDEWKSFFFPRDLISYSAEPLLVFPTHYTGEPNYISDTEDSVTIENGWDGDDEETVGFKDEL